MIMGKGLSSAERDRLAPESSQPTRFVARQPIFNARGDVIGYELLFRSGWKNFFSGEGDDAARQTLDNCLIMGLDSLVGDGLAFVNCTRESLVSRLVTLLPPARVVLEILETVEPDQEVLEACTALRAMGYRFALDDFMPRPEMRPLIELVSFVKVDFRLTNPAMRREIHELLRGSGAALLAEKVENQDEFDLSKAEGYDYFQGYFFCRPRIIADREVPANYVNYMSLMAELTYTPLDLHAVVAIVQAEASICYRLLRLANSALMGAHSPVTSVSSALMLVGESRFRVLVALAVSSGLGRDQPPALISLSLERARFCELMAPLIHQSPSEQYMLGLLSLLDAMLRTRMEVLLKSLALRDEVKAALLGVNNPVATALNLASSFESGDWEFCAGTARQLGVSEDTLVTLYTEAIQWAAKAVASSR
jgi:EAL and modified HD-GYP domain-containing signal transduction protein